MPRMITSEVSFRALAITLGVAFALQVVLFNVVIPAMSELLSPFYGIGFADDYDLLAKNISEGRGYRFFPDTAPTMMREPGYPLFLSAVFSVFGYSLPAARFANVVLAIASAAIIAVLARRVSNHRTVILGAPLLFLFHPGTVVAESRGGYELLFVFSLLLFMLAVFRALEERRLRWYALAGFALGCVVLIRSTPVLFPLFLLGYLWLKGRDSSARLADGVRVAVMIAVMVAVMSPWIVRNYLLAGKFVPTSNVQGLAVHAGQYICKRLTFDNGIQKLDREAAAERGRLASELGYEFRGGYYQYFFRTADEHEFSNYLFKTGIMEYTTSPGLLVKCASSNLFNFWFAGKNWRATAMNVIVQLPFLLLAAFGIWIGVRKGRSETILPIVLLIAYLMSVHAAIFAQARYSVPLIPFVSVLACYGLAAIVNMLRARATTKGLQ